MADLRIDGLRQGPIQPDQNVKEKGSPDFGKVIKGAIYKVDGMGKEADRSVIDLLQGKAGIPETMIALQKAGLSRQLLLAVRNKVIDSYREIMRMQF